MRSSTIQPRLAARAALITTALLGALACAKAAKPVTGTAGPATPVAAAPASAAAPAASGALSAAAPLIASLTSAVPGLSQEQAALGAGALLGLAQTKMPAGDYSQLLAGVPGAAALVAAAQDQGLPSTASLSSASVTEFLGKSGITPGQVTQLTSALGSAVGGMVPGSVANAFTAALK